MAHVQAEQPGDDDDGPAPHGVQLLACVNVVPSWLDLAGYELRLLSLLLSGPNAAMTLRFQ